MHSITPIPITGSGKSYTLKLAGMADREKWISAVEDEIQREL
jgi:hypothetical protein